MFITSKYAGYNRHGEQVAAGLFLILMQPQNDSGQFPSHQDACQTCGANRQTHEERRAVPVPSCSTHSVVARIKARAAAGIKPSEITDAEIDAWTINEFEQGCESCAAVREIKARIGCIYFRAVNVNYPIKAIVRHTSLKELGPWMMGFARVQGHRITLSGSYGADGLICTVPDAVYSAHGLELPADLREAWNKGGGWNSAGSEAPLMRKWALANLAALRK